ncbi:MAG: DUF4255 domain-containing protein [Crocinitomix sp.]|nr:DUF4255 domain-containing protein [Crocinitomix sp.]
MIAKALIQIVEGLNSYLNGVYPSSLNQAKISNAKKSQADNGISVTLINIEEDKVYKNHLNPLNGSLANNPATSHPLGGLPVMRINLYVLFAFDAQTPENYPDSLTRLTHVLSYFQSKPFQEIIIPISGTNPVEKRFNLAIDYHNISLEDSNNMWSNLGGEQKPYAMYQFKLLEIEPAITPAAVSVIQQPQLVNPAGSIQQLNTN